MGEKVTIRIGKKLYTMLYVRTFADVQVGKPLLYIDSRGRVAIALNQGDFLQTYKISPAVPIFIPRKGG
jgi:S-adenosylmethionine hydrolase